MSPNIAFYPCCANDIAEPRRLLAGLVDEIIFCDKREPRSWAMHRPSAKLPSIRLMQGDVRDKIADLPAIHVFFYRRDSTGEGGSGIYLLGKQWLKEILDHFPTEGGLIISDGKNSDGHIFSKMIRPDGYYRESWNIKFTPIQDHPLFQNHKLHVIKVNKNTSN